MLLNKTYTILLVWVLNFYLFFGLVAIYMQYQSDTLDATFSNFKNCLLFFISVPFLSILLGVYSPIFLAIILMIVLIEYKKYKIFKSYIISILFFFIAYLFLFTRVNYLKYDLEWIVTLVSLIITSLIILMTFKKNFARLDKEYNLK